MSAVGWQGPQYIPTYWRDVAKGDPFSLSEKVVCRLSPVGIEVGNRLCDKFFMDYTARGRMMRRGLILEEAFYALEQALEAGALNHEFMPSHFGVRLEVGEGPLTRREARIRRTYARVNARVVPFFSEGGAKRGQVRS
ncbi:hypothetical protein ASA1KI_39580 [Opitutales bacterium ASA1]|uniref:hypothetical protein n=1 Tax=Congregicoccus parvus TaxID=3081749 RepID=UPI002B29FDF8|nr:hypothetical protein ASA1KI_39580 [Opitutales bacterium ASA1]